MIIDAWTFDVGTTEDHVEAVASRVEQSWDNGADIVLFPEYAWAAQRAPLKKLASRFWQEVMPALQARLCRPGKMVVLGTAPWLDETTGTMRNRAPILVDGERQVQDKLFLTPWEKAFSRGELLQLLEFKGLRIAVVICLDIEIPELSMLLRGQGVDVILVPSATETLMGCERVTRCASARAVELGCAVVVSPLVGRCNSVLVDDNLGKLACYLPSQAAFACRERAQEGAVCSEGFHLARFTLDRDSLVYTRQATSETNPSLIQPGFTLPRLKLPPCSQPQPATTS